tara:strand:+ start:497 stop:868 length:372 start_codon:yes stop_codon:yes gene_type:complete
MSIENSVTLIGYLGADPKYKADGTRPLLKFSVATTRKWKTSKGEKKEKTSWHNVAIFGKLATVSKSILTKGSKVMVVGHISYSKYTKDGVERYGVDIITEEILFLSTKGKAASSDDDDYTPDE